MNLELKLALYNGINQVLNNACEKDELYWDNYIHPKLVEQMTNASELIFDAAQDAQTYLKDNS